MDANILSFSVKKIFSSIHQPNSNFNTPKYTILQFLYEYKYNQEYEISKRGSLKKQHSNIFLHLYLHLTSTTSKDLQKTTFVLLAVLAAAIIP